MLILDVFFTQVFDLYRVFACRWLKNKYWGVALTVTYRYCHALCKISVFLMVTSLEISITIDMISVITTYDVC